MPIFIRISVFLAICYPGISNATEKEDALAACGRVMLLYKQQLQPLKIFGDLSSLCVSNVRPASYWVCAEDKMKKGSKFLAATDVCKQDKK